MKKILRFLFGYFLYHVKYKNINVFKNINKCLICPNHSNIFDPTFIYPVVDDLYIMAKSEIFKNKFIAKFLNHYNVFPVNRNKTDVKSMMTSLEIFENVEKRKLLIFPEGKVIKDKKEIGKVYKKGAVYIAATTNVPIIPVYITRRPKFFSKIEVIFGEPIYIDKNSIKSKRDIIEKSKELIEKIYSLNK